MLICFSQTVLQGEALCKECFFVAFESEVHDTIRKEINFRRGESVAVAASGGKGKRTKATWEEFLIEFSKIRRFWLT